MRIINKLFITIIFIAYCGSAWAMDPEMLKLLKTLEGQPAEIKVEILEKMIENIKDFNSLKEVLKTFGSLAQTSKVFNDLIKDKKERLSKAIHSQINAIIDPSNPDVIYENLFELLKTVESPILVEVLTKKVLEPATTLPPFITLDNIELLLKKGADLNSTNKERQTLLHIFVLHKPIVAALIKHIEESGDNIQKYINTTDNYGYTPLRYALHSFKEEQTELYEEIVKFLVEKGANINAQDNEGQTALHIAMENNALELVKLLLESGADIYIKDSNEETPLHAAFALPEYEEEEGEEEIEIDPSLGKGLTQLILEHIEKFGGNVEEYINKKDDAGHIPLHHAAMAGATEAAQLLIRTGSNVDARDNENKQPLHHAAEGNSPEIVKILLEHVEKAGGDIKKYVNSQDNEGQTALHIAMENNALELVKLLLESGADPYIKDSGKETPLHAAFPVYEEEISEEDEKEIEYEEDFSNAKEITEFLLEHIEKSGGNIKEYVNEIDDEGHIPLHHAAMIGATEAAEVLIEAGSNVHALDNENKKPIDVAKNYAMRLLLEKAMEQRPEESSRN